MATTQTKSGVHSDRLAGLEAEVLALQEQLRHAQRLATIGTMTAMVAHEFNNILTPIINYANLANKNPAMVKKAIAHAANGGQRASSICRSILGMTSNQSSEPQRVNIAELIDETLSTLAREPGKDLIEITIDVDKKLDMRARHIELQQVLLNLIINARTAVLDAQARARQIGISAHREKGLVVIEVSDTGKGIPAKNLQKIFEPFFTTYSKESQTPAQTPQGHGLGLAICREIIDSAGGSISVKSTPSQGTTFTIRLPG